MTRTSFIQVILPLRLEWEPYYVLEGAAVGERVKVRFANREYVGVVSEVNVVPETVPEHIQPAFKTDLPPVHPREIVFWRAIAGYYLCSVGEVYKAAYPVTPSRYGPTSASRSAWPCSGKNSRRPARSRLGSATPGKSAGWKPSCGEKTRS